MYVRVGTIKKAEPQRIDAFELVLEKTLPMDYSLPGSSVHGIFQARALE